MAFSNSVLQNASIWDSLDEIIYLFLEDTHQWHVENPTDLLRSAWLENESGRSRNRVEQALKEITRAAYPECPSSSRRDRILIHVETDTRDPHHLGPGDALRCLRQPCRVAVENSTSDGAFLKGMLRAFDRLRLMRQEERTWKLEQLGGYGETEKHLARWMENAVGPVRILVLVDSDREFPGQDNHTIRTVTTACQRFGVPFHILQKRAIENYLPATCLEGLRPKRQFRDRLSVYHEMTDPQRDHIKLKSGFPKEWESTPQEFQDLFHGFDARKRSRFAGGLGEVWHLFNESGCLTAERVRGRCESTGRDEIPDLLDKIEALL